MPLSKWHHGETNLNNMHTLTCVYTRKATFGPQTLSLRALANILFASSSRSKQGTSLSWELCRFEQHACNFPLLYFDAPSKFNPQSMTGCRATTSARRGPIFEIDFSEFRFGTTVSLPCSWLLRNNVFSSCGLRKFMLWGSDNLSVKSCVRHEPRQCAHAPGIAHTVATPYIYIYTTTGFGPREK